MIKRYLAEFIGTFIIVFAPCAFSATTAVFAGGMLGAALISGLAVTIMIFALGPISAAHFNPAVSLGFVVAKRFPVRYLAPYWLAQFLGGIGAAGLVTVLYGPGFGAHIPAVHAIAVDIVVEAAISFILMLVIIAVATDRRVGSSTPAISIGAAVVVGVLIGGPVTGGSMNPARSMGPALFYGDMTALGPLWIYFVGPFIGAAVAALVYEFIRLSPEHAQGAPNELLAALEDISQ